MDAACFRLLVRVFAAPSRPWSAGASMIAAGACAATAALDCTTG
ncbi:hypothetical protein CHELA20_50708 [Hyphomicrobiales bacterium]|nr:hypothetical protein CHELA20_50708 [Hyphomicrobiales bacterium]CAH1676850.1 hypothetical protein CHELA41_24310 [Hyphomicrobiales bacterium]